MLRDIFSGHLACAGCFDTQSKLPPKSQGREAGLVGAMACVPVPAPLVDSRRGGSSHVDGAHPTSAAQVSCVSHHLNASP
jgi:hypothetical protein